MSNISTMKMMSSTYISTKADYTKPIATAIMSANRIDKKSEAFENILFDFKRRQTYSFLVDVLMSNNIVLLYSVKPLPKAFVTFGAKDIQTAEKKTKTFIDCSEMLKFVDGKYVCKNIDQFISVVTDAFVNLVYYVDERRYINNSSLLFSATDCFVSLFTHILDYLRVNGFRENQAKIEYMVAMYFLCNQMCFEFDSQVAKGIAMKVSKTTPKEAKIAEILLPKDDNHFMNIDTFVKHLATIFKMNELTTEVFVEKWVWQYGNGTHFGMEFFPSFASMLMDAYSGTYINNQKNIEKQCGREMVNFASSVFKIGTECYKKY